MVQMNDKQPFRMMDLAMIVFDLTVVVVFFSKEKVKIKQMNSREFFSLNIPFVVTFDPYQNHQHMSNLNDYQMPTVLKFR